MTNTYNAFSYSYYTTVILQVGSFRYHYLTELNLLLKEFNLDYEHEEGLYDWLINEALSKVLGFVFKAKVNQHYRHDVYKCVYDKFGHKAEQTIIEQLHIHKLNFLVGENIKTLIAGENIILAKGVRQ